jgi:hypothetical protein
MRPHRIAPAVLGTLALAGCGLVFALPASSDDDPDTCFTYEGTTTCQPSADVAEHGIYIAIVRCSPASAEIHGIVPDDATTVTAEGSDAPASATAGPDGTVTLTVAGANLDGLALDNGHEAPLVLTPDCDRPS